MPRAIVVTRRFERAYQLLPLSQQELVDAALTQFQAYLKTGQAPVGLGLKRLHRRTHEFRVGLSIRVVSVVEGEAVYLALVGDHDDVRRFLKRP